MPSTKDKNVYKIFMNLGTENYNYFFSDNIQIYIYMYTHVYCHILNLFLYFLLF